MGFDVSTIAGTARNFEPGIRIKPLTARREGHRLSVCRNDSYAL
jgi:hypothetical protein